MENVRRDIRELLLDKSHEKEREGKDAWNNQLFSENLKGQAKGLSDAYYLIDNYLKKYEGN